MNELKTQAEELGIKVDGRWSEERLHQEIDKALGAPQVEPFGGNGDHDGDGKAGGSVKAERLIPVRINRDFWDANGERHRKGSIMDATVEEALDGAESGALSRVK